MEVVAPEEPGAPTSAQGTDLVPSLLDILGQNLGATRNELEAPDSILSPELRSDTLQRCLRFLSDSQVVLYVYKTRYAQQEQLNGDKDVYKYHISANLALEPNTVAAVAFLKRPQPIDYIVPLSSQIQIIHLPGPASRESDTLLPYETLHTILHHALGPYLTACAASTDIGKADTDVSLATTKKKFADLELSLLHLQQNAEVPGLVLEVPRVIQEALSTAAESQIRVSLDLLPVSMLNDSHFLNDLQSTVNGWIKSIQALTRMSRDPESGSALTEINYWLSLEERLKDVDTQTRSSGVQLVLDVLQNAKRYQVKVSFYSDTGLKEALQTVQRYNLLMEKFPMDDLFSATDVSQVAEAVNLIFNHLNKKLRLTSYPVARALPLVNAISADLDSQLHRLLQDRPLMLLNFSDFENIMEQADLVWTTWEEHAKDFTNIARELMRKRGEKFMPIKVSGRHLKLQDRLAYVKTFRVNHEQLQRTIRTVLGEADENDVVLIEEIGDVDAVQEVASAYSVLRGVDVLDVSSQGMMLWAQAEASYHDRTSRVENSIIARLRDRLATAKSANEMFRVFSKFNALFVRPKIRSAIAEYQTQLIDNVKADIATLRERFKQQYSFSESHAMAQLHDLPPVSGAILWARQIEGQLDGYMRKVENVLGKDWAEHSEGQKLEAESKMFRSKLNTRPIFESWLQDVQRRRVSIKGRLFSIAKNRRLELLVTFDSQVVVLFKEVRNLIWQNFQIPHAISSVSKDAKRVYPFAVSLMESVQCLDQVNRLVESLPMTAILLYSLMAGIYKMITTGFSLRWESFAHAYDLQVKQDSTGSKPESHHVRFVKDFAAITKSYQDRGLVLQNLDSVVQKTLLELQNCAYSSQAFRDHLELVQEEVDKLSLAGYSNLSLWVAKLNQSVGNILEARLFQAINLWISEFDFRSPIILQILMRNQTIYMQPPIQHARASWLFEFNSHLSIVHELPIISSARFDMTATAQRSTFRHICCSDAINTALKKIEDRLGDIEEYVENWYRFQSLWDLEMDTVLSTLGDDLEKWLELLQDIRKTRETFDTSESSRRIGAATMDYSQIQDKITTRYDQWQHEIRLAFASRLGLQMSDLFGSVQRTRRDLEGQSLETSSTAQAVAYITIVQTCKRNVRIWESRVDTFRQSQILLSRQRHTFPSDWLFIEQLEHEWTALLEILSRRTKIIDDQSDVLRAKILAEGSIVDDQRSEIVVAWREEKPTSGKIAPQTALTTLQAFHAKTSKLITQSEMVQKAKDALDIPWEPHDELAAVSEEIADFMSVWSALDTIWRRLEDLRETAWSNVVPRKVRSSLDDLLSMTKDMPSRMRQYAAFEHVQLVLQQHHKSIPLLGELRSEAMRERHWVKVFKTLRPEHRFSFLALTLGHVWDLQLKSSENTIRRVVVQAQGEMALEEFLNSVRGTWQSYDLELINYQNKCRLIRGWDELFAKCNENLSALQSMRHSPYYKEFEEEATLWEDKLTRVHGLFDIWIDVQRQWVYLEGIFAGDADIKRLLPVESARFHNINSELMAILKKVGKTPQVLEVLNIPGVQKSLDRLADSLSKIQKALGEYLERERLSFPRFYFIGDEDLLEIIGNSKDILRVGKHLRKMFAGLAGLTVNVDTVTGFSSPEGEHVDLHTPISITKTPKINDWLALLDRTVKSTLLGNLHKALDVMEDFYTDWMSLQTFPTQIAVLACQTHWTRTVDIKLREPEPGLEVLVETLQNALTMLASAVLEPLNFLDRRKCEHLITELVHQRDITTKLMHAKVSSPDHHLWLLQMRYVHEGEGVTVKMANAELPYGFEYLGVPDRLVRTPLTDRCFLTCTQALCQRLGGSPYGPAGTGKTESVKALGSQLGRFTLVFNCDDSFDFQAMGRIFLGICRVGAWGCFDEFNRLEERILSAVSQQIQNIQMGLKHGGDGQIELAGRNLLVNVNTGIFITMNPGYAGRSNLPDNLKKLFRSVAMSKPDKELISEVMLYSQGFLHAHALSQKIVPFFDQCALRLSKQSHYDFGLRALKSILVNSGNLKRVSDDQEEAQIIVQSIRETIAPKLVQEDEARMLEVESVAFPDIRYVPAELSVLRTAMAEEASRGGLEMSETWLNKALQLYQMQKVHHGIMLVGQSGVGKTTIWKTMLAALERAEKRDSVSHVIDPKVLSKEALYGSLDSTTREWSDGLFTGMLRKIVDNLRGEDTKRHWIIFDGDVDPEWVENLNSVLDDNKLLTLPNGERISLPPNVRILFEVQDLQYATLATVSRCGMVWFNEDTVTSQMRLNCYLQQLRQVPLDLEDETQAPMAIQERVSSQLQAILCTDGLFDKALTEAARYRHIMEFTNMRAVTAFFSLLNRMCRSIMTYGNTQLIELDRFVQGKTLLSLVWAFAGDSPLEEREAFGNFVGLTGGDLPPGSLIDWDMTLPQAQWISWQSQIPQIEIETSAVSQSDVVIPTLDTARHEEVMYSWLAEHKPLLLCGPPGSGKTMTLFSALRKLSNMEVVGVNFSSATTPELLLKLFEQHCETRKTLTGTVLSPRQIGKWLVFFCDEINLPAPDRYGTQHAIAFLRQLVEQGGFWRQRTWVTLERIQFVGACNPSTDPGRSPLSVRFLRHAPLIMVDYPAEVSLQQIYGTFNRAVLKVHPNLRGYADPLTQAMIHLYLASQTRFTPQIQPHYVYSPRELSRWVKALFSAIQPLDSLSMSGLVRIWAHEALRLFQDRLVAEQERQWTWDKIQETALQFFPGVEDALRGPILYSKWLSKDYVPVDREQLREFVKARLRTFCEEELDTPIVLFDDVLDHVLRIDRVFRQPQGHLILIGVSGSGKTTLSRFVAWMNGLKVFQIKVSRKYTGENFDDDLRDVLRRAGCKGEQICFIMDESNVLDSGFLERMNTLLANAEVPGLFSGDEYASLLTACKEGAQRQGLLLDAEEELYKWFTQQIIRNLHVVFTMNPPKDGLSSKAATSPALFNRCVLNWFGDWSDLALFQVGYEITHSLDLGDHRRAVVDNMVHVHHSVRALNQRLASQGSLHLTPRHFLDFAHQCVSLFAEKRDALEDEQRHVNVGLERLHDTVDKVADLRASLAQKKEQLAQKDVEANEKLQKMLADQQEAERRKTASLEVQQALDRQEEEVAKRKAVVNADLAKAEPAVLDAQEAVGNIKRQHLTEVRSMGNPPAGVRLALNAVCTLLGHKIDDWKTIQSIVRRDDFIANIVNFDNARQMTKPLRTKMQNDFLSKEDFTYERVNRASKACGPLVQWVEAQVNFSAILDRVGPLREEADRLENDALQTRAEAKAIENTISALESSISTYKSEYALLISETQAIKTEMSLVESKVSRSMKLLASLSSEQARWTQTSGSFEAQINTIVGDVVLAAAFLTYAGLYDQQGRQWLIDNWRAHLDSSRIALRPNGSVIEYLSTADERLDWQRKGLPVDDLCIENAIVLHRFNRYPLLIDPSGRASEFLEKSRRMIVTSFLDDSFVKQLESSLRFGNAILIQDAEHLDPILSHVLNKEYQKVGGRTLIGLGKQEIDFSPAFTVYLTTRLPTADFPPDICSRTTLVNFTVTQSSLQMQTLNEVLKTEQPQVDQRRINMTKMQGEFGTHLRNLEKRLLQALNEAQGNILDSETVIDTLETLKQEAAEISRKAAETEGVMLEIEHITQQYQTIARSCSAIFSVITILHQLHHFYQFSLGTFLDIFHSVLQDPSRSGQDFAARGEIILRNLYRRTYYRISGALLQKHRLLFAMLLARVSPFELNHSLFDRIINPGRHEVSTDSVEDPLASLLQIRLHHLDRFVPAAERWIASVFGDEFLRVSDDIDRIVPQANATTPICLCSSPGFDASYKIDKSNCLRVAMGSDEGVIEADRALREAATTGSWVLIKNVHLALDWAEGLEKKLSSLKPNPGLRIFLSMETSDKMPVNLLRASRILMFEQPAGIKANIKDSMAPWQTKPAPEPREKSKVYLLLSFLHAVIQERLRFAPALGWSRHWEFNDSDFECCMVIIDHWLDRSSQGRTNISPAKIPWEMLRTLLVEMYGGKIDDAADFHQLSALVTRFMTAEAFEVNHSLVDENGVQSLLVPESNDMAELVQWVDGLPEREPPGWLGLPADAECVLLMESSKNIIADLARLSQRLEEMAEVREG